MRSFRVIIIGLMCVAVHSLLSDGTHNARTFIAPMIYIYVCHFTSLPLNA